MGSTRVLIVDDARLMAELRGTPIGRSSFDVRAVRPGQDLVAHARNLQPDVILLQDGEACPDALEAVRRLRTEPATRGIPLIYIGLGLDRERYREAGVSVFIPRPVTRLDLQEALRRVLEVRDRIALRRQVEIGLEVQVGDLAVRGRSVNLSLTGAFVVLDRRLAIGEQGVLRFQAGGRLFSLPMEIVRVGPGHGARNGVGLRFRGIDSESAGYLARFVREASDRRLMPRSHPLDGGRA